jgi:hypothetical protein
MASVAKKENNQINWTYIVIAIIIAVAILGLGAMSYVSSEKNRQIEQIKLRQAQQAQDQKTKQLEQVKQEQDEKKQTLDKCLSDARDSYDNSWYSECKSQGLLSQKCISLHDMTFAEYAKQNNIPSLKDNPKENVAAMLDFDKQNEDCTCRLPKYNADTNDKRWEDAKALCAKLYGN